MSIERKPARLPKHFFEWIAVIAIVVICGYIMYPAYIAVKDFNEEDDVGHNASAIRHALISYISQNDGHLPPADQWCHALQPLIEGDGSYNLLKWERYGKRVEPFAMVRALGGVDFRTIDDPEHTVLFFEIAERKPNVSGDISMQVPPHGNSKWNLVILADCRWKIKYATPDGKRSKL